MVQLRQVAFVLLPLLLLACSDSSPTEPRGPNLPRFDIGSLASCGAVGAAYGDELAFIRYCTRASDCGQPLVGTSCGCTRDLVARSDADTTRFYALLNRLAELGCEPPGGVSTCDCPAVDGFACVANQCTWNYL